MITRCNRANIEGLAPWLAFNNGDYKMVYNLKIPVAAGLGGSVVTSNA